ncbi:MAG: hypothetical protein U0744_02245 [Gemmataceae bacterium]
MLRISALCVLACAGAVLGQSPDGRAYLLRPSKGELPSDTGLEDKTKPKIVNHPDLGEKTLSVPLAAEDSFGVGQAKVRNWASFKTLRFDAVNGESANVVLQLNILHAASKNFGTRVVREIALKPGKNEVVIDLRLTNVDKSKPRLDEVKRWYIAVEGGKPAKLFFSDIVLEGGAVDKTPPYVAKTDPARLDRIRAAKMPVVKKPISFLDPGAEAIDAALDTLPANNAINILTEDWPLHPNSKNIIGAIGKDLVFRYNLDMGYIFVPTSQKRVPLARVEYADESDKGPYPIPDEVPIEGWPVSYKGLTLPQVQAKKEDADRHAIVIDPATHTLYEFYQLQKTAKGWEATQASIFDLKSNKLRPDGWTSTDAAGLPIYPLVVRFDELKRGVVDHALRVTVPRSRKEYVYPATHQAGHAADANLPRMGERIRLKKDIDLSKFSKDAQTILRAAQRYGMLVADNGIAWAVSVAPDPRIPNMNEEFRRLRGSDFEVIAAPPGYRIPE